MKRTFLLLAVLGVVAAVLSGCETDTPSQIYLTITPREVIIRKGESVEFVASGWHEYVWRLSDTSLGYLSAPTGERTVYTSLRAGNASQILTVSIEQTGISSTTNSTVTVVSADAYITHQ